MLKRLTAAIIASAAFVGWFETPAYSDPMDEAALMVVMAGPCGQHVPDAVFLPEVTKIALAMGVNIPTAMELVKYQAVIFTKRLVDAGNLEAFCAEVQHIKW